MRSWLNIITILSLGAFFGTAPALAQPDRDKDPLSYDRNIGGLLSRYCYKCHRDEESHGDVNLSKDDNPRLIFENAVVWRTALELIETKQMPPDDAKQPSNEERELIAKFLHQTLDRIDCESADDPGAPHIRRLNRVEYDRSIQFLTGLDLNVADAFPPDATSYGFENIATSLTLTPVQVEQYYTAAQKVVKEMLETKRQELGDDVGYQRVFFINAEQGAERDAARTIMEKFATRAFRREVESDWVDKLLVIYDRAITKGLDYEHAVGEMIAAVLISPRFLMRYEHNQPDVDEPYRIDDYELASRLSFFLWSAPPDDALLELASQGNLHQQEQLAAQVDRMLSDPKSEAIIDHFFASWLQFATIDAHQPDKETFPAFNTELHQAIVSEPRLMLAEVIREDRSINDLLDADYTYVNQSLAEHYGLQSVQGNAFVRVKLTDRRRGGVLTMAALLMAQADPGRTNVPRRGNFLAGTILGTPAPPPPPNVPELKEPEASAKVLTLRERLEAHRADAQCAVCHDKIDPLGFAFENYDAIGAWRDTEVGKPINASGELPSGDKFNGAVELKDLLLKRREGFARTFASQLLIYALGRGPIPSDKCVIDDVMHAANANEYRIRSFLRAIIHSDPFQMRRNPEL